MTTRSDIKWATLCVGAAIALAGCARHDHSHMGHAHKSGEHGEMAVVKKAVAKLEPTQGNTAKGTITFTKVDNGVRVVVDITGLTPGEHGFHIHEKGDCSAADGATAGAHFNPTGAPHGGPDSPQHHLGDLGNVTADQSGKAHLDRIFTFLSMEGPNSIVGKGVIVHAGKDDLTSQPAGNAGARVACGAISAE